MQRSSGRLLTTHIGSLPRPEDLPPRVHPEIMWAKFEAMVEGARLASNELWSR
jgi:methionine synthase II (cobalamin-independent)